MTVSPCRALLLSAALVPTSASFLAADDFGPNDWFVMTGEAVGRHADALRKSCGFPPTGEFDCVAEKSSLCTTCGWLVDHLEQIKPKRLYGPVAMIPNAGYRPLGVALDLVQERRDKAVALARSCGPQNPQGCQAAYQATDELQAALTASRTALERSVPREDGSQTVISSVDLFKWTDRLRKWCRSPKTAGPSPKGGDRMLEKECVEVVGLLDKYQEVFGLDIGSVVTPPCYDRRASFQDALVCIDTAYYDLALDADSCKKGDPKACDDLDNQRIMIFYTIQNLRDPLYRPDVVWE